MKHTILATIYAAGMIQPGDTIAVALSGGADSVALFHFLLEQRAALQIGLVALHFHHGLRGEEADHDAVFVERLCKENGVPLYTGHGHMREKPCPPSMGEEAWARQLRYCFFEEIALAHHAKIATAHTLSDNAETVLFRAARGAGPKGLGGIPPRRGVFIRPLLGVSRAEVEAYCKVNRLAYVTDSTNASPAYARNRLRHSVLPALEKVHPGAAASLSRMAADMRVLDEWLEQQAFELLEKAGAGGKGHSAEMLLAAPAPLRLYALAKLGGRDADRATLARMEQVLRGELGAVQLRGGVFANVRQGRFVVYENPVEFTNAFGEIECRLGDIPLSNGLLLRVLQHKTPPLDVSSKKTTQKGLLFTADYDRIVGCSVFRTRKPGDCFAPPDRNLHKSLKKWMNEQQMPPHERNTVPLLARGGTILWIAGAGFCEEARPNSETTRWVTIELV